MEPQKLETPVEKGTIRANKHSIVSDLPAIKNVRILPKEITSNPEPAPIPEPTFDPETGLATIHQDHYQDYQVNGKNSELFKKLQKTTKPKFSSVVDKVAKEQGIQAEHLFAILRKAGFNRLVNKAHTSDKKWSINNSEGKKDLHVDGEEGLKQLISNYRSNLQEHPQQRDRELFDKAKRKLFGEEATISSEYKEAPNDPRRKFVSGLEGLFSNTDLYNSDHFQNLGKNANERVGKIIKFFKDKSRNGGDIRKEFKALTSGNNEAILDLLRKITEHHMFEGKVAPEKPKVYQKPTPQQIKEKAAKMAPKTATRENNYGLMA